MKKFFSPELFKDALFRNNLNRNSFAELAKIPKMTVYGWNDVDNVKKREHREAIERILGVKYEDLCVTEGEDIPTGITNTQDIESLHYESSVHDHRREWPVIGSSRGGPWLETIESGYPGISDEWVEAPHGVTDENGYALRMLGDSMIPEFPEDSIVYVSPHGEVLNGQFAVVIIESRLDDRRESCVKQVFLHPDHITLHSLNPKYPDMDIPRANVIAMHKIIECKVVTVTWKRYE